METTSPLRASAFDLVASQPWAILPDMLETIATVARRENESIETVEARLGRPLQNTRKVTMRDQVAVIPVTGPIFRYANLFTDVSGATSLEVLTRDFTAAADDPAVKHIVLNIDSPGGQANGIAELAQLVRASAKPVTAYVDGQAASAAYWLAASASRIVMSKTAMVGSIGAVVTLDAKKREGQIEIVSSQSPNKRPDITTDAGRGQIQALIDGLAQVFINDVAQYRGVSAETVITKFGGGGVFLAAEAVALGMADEVGTFEGVIAGLSGANAKRGGILMANENGAPDAEKPVINREYLAANHSVLLAELMTEGATAERARILGIQAAALPGHDKLVAQLIEEGVSVEAAGLRMVQAEKASLQGRADALRADAPKPVDHSPAPAEEAPAATETKSDPTAIAAKAGKLVADAKARGESLSYTAAVNQVMKEPANG